MNFKFIEAPSPSPILLPRGLSVDTFSELEFVKLNKVHLANVLCLLKTIASNAILNRGISPNVAFIEAFDVIRAYLVQDIPSRRFQSELYFDRPDLLRSMRNADSLLAEVEATSGDIVQLWQVLSSKL